LILRKIIKIVATRCQILTLKCTKIDFGPDPVGGAYSVPPDPLAGFTGASSKGREGEGRRAGRVGWRPPPCEILNRYATVKHCKNVGQKFSCVFFAL